MALTIMKRIRFSAGHRLYGHGGKCEYFHGHNYVAEFYVSSSEDEVDDVGRIIDFKELKTRLKTCLLYTSPSPRDQRGSRMPSSA